MEKWYHFHNCSKHHFLWCLIIYIYSDMIYWKDKTCYLSMTDVTIVPTSSENIHVNRHQCAISSHLIYHICCWKAAQVACIYCKYNLYTCSCYTKPDLLYKRIMYACQQCEAFCHVILYTVVVVFPITNSWLCLLCSTWHGCTLFPSTFITTSINLT